MLGVKYCTECCLRNVFNGLSLLGVPAVLPPSRPLPSFFCLGMLCFFCCVTQMITFGCEVVCLFSLLLFMFCLMFLI